MVEIVRANSSHVDLLARAVRELHGKSDVDVQAIETFIEDQLCIWFVAIDAAQVVGSLYGYALRRPETTRPKFFLYEIDVAETHRRQGIGRRLVEAFVEIAKQHDAIGVWVQAKFLDTQAQLFYEACNGKREEDGDILFSFRSLITDY